MSYGAKQYKQTAVTTANRGQVLIMLYEACIRHLSTAEEALRADPPDLNKKSEAIGKAHDIINELLNSLNFELGGDIAVELERLYNFMVGQITEANIHSKPEPIKSVRDMMQNLLEGWRGAVGEVFEGKEGQTSSDSEKEKPTLDVKEE